MSLQVNLLHRHSIISSLILIANVSFRLKLYFVLTLNIFESDHFLVNKFNTIKVFSVSLETAAQWVIKALDENTV